MNVGICSLRSNEFEREFIDSVINTGFAVVTHHGIDSALIKDVQMAWRLFFLDSVNHKTSFINKDNINMGYHTFKKEKAVGSAIPDLKEFFHWKPGQKMPSEVSGLTQLLYYQLEDLGMNILGVLDKINNTNYQESCLNSENTLLRSLYYPAMNFEHEKGAVRAAAHEDINFITLLVAASAPGLEVMDKKGNWHEVPHRENSVVVNMGDMLQLSSNGSLRSTTHRVVNPTDNKNDRISLPLFIHPSPSTILHQGTTAQQFLDQRLEEIGLK